MDQRELEHRFAYHPPRSGQRVNDHQDVRHSVRRLASHLNELLPEGREKSLVVTKLEEATMWANAALARADDPDAEVSEEDAAAGP